MFDVIIISGGPAGLAVAIVLGCAVWSVPRLNARAAERLCPTMHNLITRDRIPPAEQLPLVRDEITRYPTVEVSTLAVLGAEALDESGCEARRPDGGTERVTTFARHGGVRCAAGRGAPRAWTGW